MALMNNSNFGIRRQMILSIILILIFAGVNLGMSKIGVLIPHLLVAVGGAYIFDSIIKYISKKRFYFDETALITGLIVAFVINPGTSLLFVGLISLVAILSKNFITINNRHIFNPAAFGIVAVGLLFPQIVQSWWVGSEIYLIIILGLLIIYKIGRLSILFSYIITLFVLKLSFMVFSGNLSTFLPDFWIGLSKAFIFFMLIEPQTSPSTRFKKIIFGIIAAVFSFIFLNLQVFSSLSANGILLGVLIANLYFIISQLYKESQKKILMHFITIAIFITIITYVNPIGNDKALVRSNINMMNNGHMGSNINVIRLYKVYSSPGGKDKVSFDISMSGEKINSVKTNITKTNATSKAYIQDFNDAVGSITKGKTIKQLKNIDTIGGASLTTNALKEALKNL